MFAYLLSVSFQENESRTLFSHHLEFAPSQPFESCGCYFLWFLCFTDISLSLFNILLSAYYISDTVLAAWIQQRKKNICLRGIIFYWKEIDDKQINKYIPCQSYKQNKGIECDGLVSMNVWWRVREYLSGKMI